jgi:glycosyltransferase involved in cell wall biosynthesis
MPAACSAAILPAIDPAMNVLYLQDHGGIGGAQLSLLDSLDGLAAIQSDVKPHVVVGEAGFLHQQLSARRISAQVVGFPEFRKLRDFPKRKKFVAQLAGICRERKIDLVHANNHQVAPWSALASRAAELPACCTVREIVSVAEIAKYRVLENHQVIVITRAVLKQFPAAARPKIVQIYNAIAEPDFVAPAREALVRLNIPPHAGPRIGFLGRLSRRKGPQVLLEAVPAVVQAVPSAIFIFIGGGDHAFVDGLRSQAKTLQICNHVFFTGELEAGARFLPLFDLFIVPSLMEPLGRSTVEAMYGARPIVATNTGGTVEIIEHDKSGRLVPPENPNLLAQEILFYLKNPQVRRRHGSAARRRALELFNPENYAARIAGIYAKFVRPPL